MFWLAGPVAASEPPESVVARNVLARIGESESGWRGCSAGLAAPPRTRQFILAGGLIAAGGLIGVSKNE